MSLKVYLGAILFTTRDSQLFHTLVKTEIFVLVIVINEIIKLLNEIFN